MIKLSKWTGRALFVGLVASGILFAGAYPRSGEASSPAATAPSLGTAKSFAVLEGSTVTNTGPTVVRGNLGVWPGSAITGFPPGIVVPPGTIHAGDAVAQQAQNNVTTAYNNLAGQPCDVDLTGQDLGGKTLTPGVYCFPNTSAQLTGTLTLNAQGNPDAVFIFQIGSTLTTASNSSVLVINGGSACNVYWQVGSSATLGTATAFKGNILALTSITLNTRADILPGRALARNGAVTMDDNRVSIEGCAPPATSTPVPATKTAVPATRTVIAAIQTATAIALLPTATPGHAGGGGGSGNQPTFTPMSSGGGGSGNQPTFTPMPSGGGGGSGNQSTLTPMPGAEAQTTTAVPNQTAFGLTATPVGLSPTLLPTTGGSSNGMSMVWLALAGAGIVLAGLSLMRSSK